MLRLSKPRCDNKLRLVSHGYRYNEDGTRDYVRVFNCGWAFYVQLKLRRHGDLHVKYDVAMPYHFTESGFIELIIDGFTVKPCDLEAEIEHRLSAVWFE